MENNMINTLEIFSNQNPDNIGYWERTDVEHDMREIGYEVKNNNSWLEYVLNHLEIAEWVYHVIINNNFVSGSFMSENFGDLVVKKS